MARGILSRPLMTRLEARAGERPAPSLLFDGVIAALGGWFVAGVFVDGWAHQHVPELETFFTPWHAILYSGFMAMAAVIVVRAALNYRHGYALARLLPAGYDLSLLGVILFMIGGVGDLVWHTLFGIEVNVEALLSPTHLLLALGGILAITGPLRAAWYRSQQPRGLVSQLPMLLSVLYTFSLLAFFTQYAHPFGETLASRGQAGGFSNQALGITSILLQAAILMGFVLLIVRRFSLPFGSLALILVINTALVTFMRAHAYTDPAIATGPLPLVGVALLAGLVGDVLIALFNPSLERPTAFRVFAFTFPFVLYAFYFAALLLFGGGIGWSVHLWTGAIILAGVVGLLLSYAFVPPQIKLDAG